jgi:hypothetical protein
MEEEEEAAAGLAHTSRNSVVVWAVALDPNNIM